jgi:predicted ArsR family transcriptional regulator
MTRAWTKADTRALMLAKLEESAYPLTAFQLALRTHLSGSTVKKHLSQLRQQGIVEVSNSRWSVATRAGASGPSFNPCAESA